MFHLGDDNRKIHWTWSEHARGKRLYSWILEAAYDLVGMKARGEKEKEADEEKKIC